MSKKSKLISFSASPKLFSVINEVAADNAVTRTALITSILINDRDIRAKLGMINAPDAPPPKQKKLTVAQQEEKQKAAQDEYLAKMEDSREQGRAANKAYQDSPERERQLKHAARINEMEAIKIKLGHVGRLDTLFDIPDNFFEVIPDDDDFSVPPFLSKPTDPTADLENIMADLEDMKDL